MSETRTVTYHVGCPGHSRYCLPEDGGAYLIYFDVLLYLEDGTARIDLKPHEGLDPIQLHQFNKAWSEPEPMIRDALKYLEKPSRNAFKQVRFLREWLRRREVAV